MLKMCKFIWNFFSLLLYYEHLVSKIEFGRNLNSNLHVPYDYRLERDSKLSELEERADALQDGSAQFEKQAGALKNKFWLENLKSMIAMGVVAVIVLGLLYWKFSAPAPQPYAYPPPPPPQQAAPAGGSGESSGGDEGGSSDEGSSRFV